MRGKIARAVGTVGFATLLSRILGFVRDVVLASLLGTGLSADAFFVAFRIPNLLRNLMGEGSLTLSFVPIFTDYMTNRSRSEAFRLASVSLTLAAIALLIVSLLGVIFSPLIVRAIAQGFSADPEKFQLTVHLNRIIFPYIFLIGLTALCMGILNSLNRFGPPAAGPIFLNLALIFSALLMARAFERPVEALAMGVLLGGMLQFSFQLPFLKREGFSFQPEVDLRHPGVNRIAALMGPSIFGTAVAQLNILVSTQLASFLPEGSVSYLYYADRLAQLPLGVFAIAIATVILPTLSYEAARQDYRELRRTLFSAFRLTTFVVFPAMVGLIVLREPIIAILFERGAFTRESTLLTAQALLFYSMGLWAVAGVRVLVPAFYAMKDTRTPVKVAAISLLANLAFSLALMGPLKHGGLALANSLASMVNLALLTTIIMRRLGAVRMGGVARFLSKIILASAPMALTAFVLGTGNYLSVRFLNLGLALMGAVAVYLTMGYILKMEELSTLAHMVGLKGRSLKP